MNLINQKQVLGALLLVLTASSVFACPEQPPAGMVATRVGEDVVVNGMTVSMLQVQAREPAAVILARLEKQWKENGYDVKRSTAAKWNVLSALSEKCMTTLQLVDGPGAFGYFAVNRLDKPAAVAPTAGLALPPGAKVLSSVASNDDGRVGTTMALTSRQPLETVSEFFVGSLRSDNWGAVRSDIEMDPNMKPRTALVTGQRGRRRIDVVIWREQETQIVINVADSL